MSRRELLCYIDDFKACLGCFVAVILRKGKPSPVPGCVAHGWSEAGCVLPVPWLSFSFVLTDQLVQVLEKAAEVVQRSGAADL